MVDCMLSAVRYCCYEYNFIIILSCRCDQYRWVHQGTRTLKHRNHYNICKKSSVIDTELDKKGDKRFRRHEYWGVGSIFLVHYLGDSTIFRNFKHRSSKKNTKPFVRSAPHVKKKVNLL